KICRMGKMGGDEIFFSNAGAYMALAVILTTALMLGATAGRRLVPNRLQSLAELTYEFVASSIRNTAGAEGMKFFPLVFSLFMFVLVTNLVGLVPYAFTPA